MQLLVLDLSYNTATLDGIRQLATMPRLPVWPSWSLKLRRNAAAVFWPSLLCEMSSEVSVELCFSMSMIQPPAMSLIPSGFPGTETAPRRARRGSRC